MGNKDKTKLNQDIQAERTRSQNQFNQFYGEISQDSANLRQQDSAERANIMGMANQSFATGGVSQADRDYLRGRSEYKPIAGTYGGETPESDDGGGGGGGGEDGGGGGDYGIGGGGYQPPALFSRSDAGYEEFAGTGGVDMGKLEESLGGFRELSSKTGGFDEGRLANIEKAGKDFAAIGESGGYDPAELGKLRAGVESMREYGRTGGMDPDQVAGLRGIRDKLVTEGGRTMSPEDIAKFRGTGFQNFADTGGFTPGEVNMMRSRSNAAIPAMYNAEMQNLEGRRNIQGGYAPGADALRGRLLRQRGQDMASAARDTELGISDQVRAGKQYGITGMAGQEVALQKQLGEDAARRTAALSQAGEGGLALENALAGNKLAGMQAGQTAGQGLEQKLLENRLAGIGGSAQTNMELQNAINQSRVSGLQGIQKTNVDAQGLMQSGRLQGLQGMMQVDQARQQAAAQEAANSASRYAADAGAGASRYATDRQAAEYDANMALKYDQLGSANELGMQELMQKDRLAGMGTAAEMYGQTSGPLSQNNQMRFNLINSQSGANQGLLGQQYQAATLPGTFDRAMQGINAAAGVAGTVFSGGLTNAIPKKKPAGGTPYDNAYLSGS